MKKIFTLLSFVALGISANAQTNLITNSSFENWTSGTPDDWWATGITYTQSSSSHSGTYAAGVTSPAPTGTQTSANKTINPTPDISINQGVTYVFSGWYLDNTPNASFKYWNQWRTSSADTGANSLQASSFSSDSPSWVFFTAEGQPNATATLARPGLRVYGTPTANGGIIYFDDIMFYDKSTMATIDIKDFDKKVKMNTLVADALTLELPSKSTVNIYSVDGKLVSSNRVNSGESINVSNLQKGNYVVTVQDNFNNKVSRKIIKK